VGKKKTSRKRERVKGTIAPNLNYNRMTLTSSALVPIHHVAFIPVHGNYAGTDTVNELMKYLPALHHLSLSCATLPWNDIQMILGNLGNVQSRACVSSTLETLELSRFIYPGSFSFDMPRLKQLFLLNPYK
jgi:hypothetical protein